MALIFQQLILIPHNWVISSAVEHLVYTERVGGSIPSSPTILLLSYICIHCVVIETNPLFLRLHDVVMRVRSPHHPPFPLKCYCLFESFREAGLAAGQGYGRFSLCFLIAFQIISVGFHTHRQNHFNGNILTAHDLVKFNARHIRETIRFNGLYGF